MSGSSGRLPVASADGVARNTAFAFVSQIAGAAFTAGLTLFLVRALGPTAFGVFSLALGVSALLLIPADFGISGAMSRFLAERRGQREGPAVIAEALRLKLATGLLIGAGLFALAGPIADAYGVSELAWPLRGMALALVGQTIFVFFVSATTTLGRVSLSLRAVLAESVTEVTASIGLVLLGAGATGAAFGRAIGYLIGATVAMVLMVRLLGRPALDLTAPPVIGRRRMLSYAGAVLIVDGAFTLYTQIDVLVIGALASTASVGFFQASARLTTLLYYPGQAIASGIAPRVVRRDDDTPDVKPLRAGVRLLILIQPAIVVPVLVWAEPIVHLLLGSAYADSTPVLRWLSPYIYLSGFAPLVSSAVTYLGEARRRIPITLLTVALNIAIDVYFIPKIGIVAGAIGTSAAYLIYVPGHFRICQQATGLRLRPLLPTLGRSVLAAAAMAGVLFAFGTSRLSVIELIAGGFFATAAYGGVLAGSGEFRNDEVRGAFTMLRRAVGR